MTLLSDDYQKTLQTEHARSKWGVAGMHYAERIFKTFQEYNCETAVDYGAGAGRTRRKLVEEFGIPAAAIVEYEPGIAEKSALPSPADLVYCTDVLEHVEPDLIDDVLAHLASLVKKVGYFTIGLKEANRVLADGRNAHLIIESPEWWKEKLQQHFTIVFDGKHGAKGDPHTYSVIVTPKE